MDRPCKFKLMTVADIDKIAPEPIVFIKSNGEIGTKPENDACEMKTKKEAPLFATLDKAPVAWAGRKFNSKLTPSRLIPPSPPRPVSPVVVVQPPAIVQPSGVVTRSRRESRRTTRFGDQEDAKPEEFHPRYIILKITKIKFDEEHHRVWYGAKVAGKKATISLSPAVICKNGGKDLIRRFHESYSVVEMPESVRALL